MAVDLRIAGGTVVTPGGQLQADVLVDGGKIVGLVSHDLPLTDVGRIVDARGKHVLPGMVDVHVHTREPGYTHKEDILTTTQQAAAGGVTTIFGMPNLDPPTSSVELLEEVFGMYRASAVVDWNHNPAATRTDQIAPMSKSGIRAYKVYMVVDTGRTYPHPAGTGMHAHGDILRMMDTIAPTGLRFIIHPHDQSIMDYIERGHLDAGENTPQGYAKALAARNGVIWDTAVAVITRLSEASGCPLHIAHMQTEQAIDTVRRAKARGVQVTCEVNHWGLFLSRWEHVETLGPYALSYWIPDDARAALWQGVNDGTIDVLSSDHAPHTREEKEIGWTQMWASHTGTPGIQYQYPLLLDAVTRGQLTLERAIDMVGHAPARHFGLAHKKGSLSVGRDADVVLADLNAPWTITNDGVLSRCGWTPYDGRECRARILATYVRGQEVFANGQVTGQPGFGQLARA